MRYLRMARLAWMCLLAFAAVGCARLGDADREAGLLTDFGVEVDGESRIYDIYLPDGDWDDPPRALVILLHGNRSSKEDLNGTSFATSPYSLWQPLADSENFALLIPQGSDGPEGDTGWNDCRADASGNPTTNDVAFLVAAAHEVAEDRNIDLENVFAVGTSNGGHMAQRLADEAPSLVRGIGVIAAGVTANSACASSNEPVAALFMWGTADPIAPFAGGQMASDRGEILSADASIARWVERNGLAGTPTETNFPDLEDGDDSTVVRASYRTENRAPVDLYRVVGGGHTEPSISEQYRRLFERVVGRQNHDIEMAEEVWAFFEDTLDDVQQS